MIKQDHVRFILLFVAGGPNAQINPPSACATDEVWAATCAANPSLEAQAEALEVAYQQAMRLRPKSGNGEVCVLPVVVHIIHDGGPENISDAQVQQGLDYLNAAFRNTGYYDPTTGVDIDIEFCLAQRDPEGNVTSGIVRYRSPVTDMTNHTRNEVVSLANWPSRDYINIRLVRRVCAHGNCDVGGFATLPSAHGLIVDGIVIAAALFGANPTNTSIAVHEMGHYLGLLHTFNGGCANGDCLAQGDRVCDTPPDNMTDAWPCGLSINSCTTDTDDPSPQNPFRSMALGGQGDQADMYHNYLDYSTSACYDRFTAGQKARMHYFLHNARASLLASHACYPPCARPVSAYFTTPTQVIEAGELLVFNNASSQAASYRWFMNDSLVATSSDLSFQFLREGVYTVRLEVVSDSLMSPKPSLLMGMVLMITGRYTPMKPYSELTKYASLIVGENPWLIGPIPQLFVGMVLFGGSRWISK